MNRKEAVIFVLRNSSEIREWYEKEHGLKTEEFIDKIEKDINPVDTLASDSSVNIISSIIEDGLKTRIIGEEIEETTFFEII